MRSQPVRTCTRTTKLPWLIARFAWAAGIANAMQLDSPEFSCIHIGFQFCGIWHLASLKSGGSVEHKAEPKQLTHRSEIYPGEESTSSGCLWSSIPTRLIRPSRLSSVFFSGGGLDRRCLAVCFARTLYWWRGSRDRTGIDACARSIRGQK